MLERRKGVSAKTSPLPDDYLNLVNDVFTTNFDAELKVLADELNLTSRFDSTGGIFLDEVLLCVSLMHEGRLTATSVYASCDFDPRASSPTVQDLLAACVDAVGTIYSQILAEKPLSTLESVPINWTPCEVNQIQIYVKVDKANPHLDRMTDEWLAKHDPEQKQQADEAHRATEQLFVTGPSSKNGSGSGTPTTH